MALVSAYVLPHPPVIISAVGKGQEKAIQKTRDAFHIIAKQIQALKPDTIIIMSPHADTYSDYVHISPKDSVTGDFSAFGAKGKNYHFNYDTVLRNKLVNTLIDKGIHAGTKGQQASGVDHGSLVPLAFIQEKYQDFKLIRISQSGLSKLDHVKIGKGIKEVANNTSKRIVFIASGDLSHKLKEEGPYGYHPSSTVFDHVVTKHLENGEFLELLSMDNTLIREAAECGMRSFYTLAGVLDQSNYESTLHSYEGPFGVGYAVVSYDTIKDTDSVSLIDRYLSKEEARIQAKQNDASSPVKLAKKAIMSQFYDDVDVETDDDFLKNERAGCFVTLYSFGELRGCIGTMDAVRKNLIEEIKHNAISAAFKDHRFSPIKKEDLPYITISVDILGPLEPIKDQSKLDPNQYGVMVEHSRKHGVLLPHIGGINTVKEQLSAVLRKAGIEAHEPYRLYRFEVTRYH